LASFSHVVWSQGQPLAVGNGSLQGVWRPSALMVCLMCP
jgi:hypothetical protein